MFDWLSSFENPAFMPHGHCYLWRPDILWTHVISDALVALAYFAIPITLIIFVTKRKSIIPFADLFWLFIAFIFLCGTTHVASIYTTWHPVYEIEGWIKAATAFISVLTAIVMIPRLPILIALPGIHDKYLQAQNLLQEAKEENLKMEAVYKSSMTRENRILELKGEVNQLLARLNEAPKYSTQEDV